MSQERPEEEIRINVNGQEGIVDFTRPTIAHYRFTDESEFADVCFEKCDPEGMREYVGHQMAAEFCMTNTMQGGRGGEYIIDISAKCDGPKRKLLKGQVCGARLTRTVVALPFDETHPERIVAEEDE